MFSLVTFSLDIKDYGHLSPYSRQKARSHSCNKHPPAREAAKYFWCCINAEKTE